MLLIEMVMNVVNVIIMKNFNKNMNNNKVFYNAVINVDLFYTIYDYLRFNPNVAHQYKILSTDDFDNLTCDDWKDVAEDAIFWLMHEQLPKVYTLGIDDDSPSMNTWGTLYYQTLAYFNRSYPKYRTETIRGSEIEKVVHFCNECIEDLKDLMDKIREPNDNDI